MNFAVKLAGAVLLVTCSTGAGFLLSLRLRQRRDFLADFITFLKTVGENIRFTRDGICSVVRSSLPKTLEPYFSDNGDFRQMWQDMCEKLSGTNGLKPEDTALISELGDALGAYDLEGQLNRIELYISLFTASLNNSTEEYKQKSKLYKILGFSLGAAIAVMLL